MNEECSLGRQGYGQVKLSTDGPILVLSERGFSISSSNTSPALFPTHPSSEHVKKLFLFSSPAYKVWFSHSFLSIGLFSDWTGLSTCIQCEKSLPHHPTASVCWCVCETKKKKAICCTVVLKSCDVAPKLLAAFHLVPIP